VLEVRELRKVYPGGVEAVQGIDFDVAEGEVFGLLGPNGAGKSTTIGILTTTLQPTSGTARVAGHDVVREPLAARRASSVVFQEAVVDRSFTGRRNLELHARLWGVESPPIDELAERLGIADLLDRPVAGYSGGERRRLELARALSSRPRVLFLDEPTVGLDPRIRAELLDLVGGLRRRDELTIVLTTHYLDEAEKLCDRIGVMHGGKLVASGTPAELRSTLGPELLELHVDGSAALAVAALRGYDAFAVGSTVTVPLRAGDPEPELDELPVRAFVRRPPTLDDVYLRLTGEAA
jgi:ABC-2 type transport system ATP-binding protein